MYATLAIVSRLEVQLPSDFKLRNISTFIEDFYLNV